jgi:hypothetical protein
MKTNLLAKTVLIVSLVVTAPPLLARDLSDRDPWEKFSVSVGAFVSDTNSNVRVGSGLGLDVDVEKVLGLDSQQTVFRSAALWRFTSSRKHRLDASWFALRRAATRSVGEDFDIKNREGNTVTIQAGTTVETNFDLDIIETTYSYSFLQDERVDLAAIAGVYVMPIHFGLKASGLATANESLNFTAPLPVFGLRMDVALSPKWFVRSGTQIFAIKYGDFSGRLAQTRIAVEYLPFRHFGFGAGIDSMRFRFESKASDAKVDVDGNVNFEYVGGQFYAKYFF